MKHIALKETRELLRRLERDIQASGTSLRQLSERTQDLDIPERLYHSTLSNIFRGRPGKNLYLQQWILLLKLIGSSPSEALVGREGAALAETFNMLPPRGKRALLAAARDQVSGVPGGDRQARQLGKP